MTTAEIMLPVLRHVAAARAAREGRPMVLARSPSCWTVHPEGENRPGYEPVETVAAGDGPRIAQDASAGGEMDDRVSAPAGRAGRQGTLGFGE